MTFMSVEKKAALQGPDRDWNKLANVAALVTAIAGLIAAIGALYKPESSARKTYDTMSQGMDKVTKDLEATHQELDDLRNACKPYIQEPQKLPLPEAHKEPVGFKPPPYKAVTGTSDVLF
jgi:hypothetical protein